LKRNIKIYIKNAATCFGLITIIRECAIWALLKLLLLKQSVIVDDSDCFSNSNFSKAQIAQSLMMVVKPKHVRTFLM
jgi:hypothetical protein